MLVVRQESLGDSEALTPNIGIQPAVGARLVMFFGGRWGARRG